MTTEDKQKLAIMATHYDRIKYHHPGDDSPYAYTYGGYSVRDTRREIARRRRVIKEKYVQTD